MTSEAMTHGPIEAAAPRLDVEAVRRDFPALSLEVYGKPLAYLDNAATSQKPQSVIEAEANWYRDSCANVHRGVHALSVRATAAFEGARSKIHRFINSASARERSRTAGRRRPGWRRDGTTHLIHVLGCSPEVFA